MNKPTKVFYLFFAISFIAASPAIGNNASVLLKIGDKAPDFTLNDPNGKPISLSSLKGKVVLLDFWASWCGYCKEANAELIPLYNTFKENGFEVFSISVDNKKDAWVNAIKNQNLPWPNHGSDLKGWEGCKVSQMYQVEVLPTTYLIDETGIIIGIALDEYDLEKKLNHHFFEQIRFYPNTATTKIFFTGKAKYEIIDSKGVSLLKGRDVEVDITGLDPGEYVIKYEDKTEKFTKRNNTQSPVTFYPERVDDKITMSREADFEIFNSKGKMVKKGKATVVEVAELQAGVYHLSIEGNMHSFLKK
ncbi:MAG: redoxin domain-containing protein [Cytophagaceae bacterium]|nr:redoxin domain-containing protein [Cytophagaceae bacterium]